jgi:iron complex outermembrane receptor protein
MRLSVAVAALCLSIVGLSVADDVRASIRKRTDIPAQELGTALRTLAKERGFQLMYLSDTVEPRRTAGAVGEFTTDEALTRILSGTGLTYRYLDDKTVTILPASSVTSGGASTKAQEQRSNGANVPNSEESKSLWDRFRVAQVDQGKASNDSSVEKQDEQSAKKKGIQLEEVIVTGSRIGTVAGGQQVQPVRTYTRKDIEQSGQSTATDFLNSLPDVSVSSFVGDRSSISGNGGTTVQLHGLPVGTTLLLLNGRRLETSSNGFFDLNNIPVSAIERVDVLPVGAAAIYGADALGGAVNILLRQNLSGLETNATVGHAAGVTDTRANLAWGKSWERGSISLLGSYQERTPRRLDLLSRGRLFPRQCLFAKRTESPWTVVAHGGNSRGHFRDPDDSAVRADVRKTQSMQYPAQ